MATQTQNKKRKADDLPAIAATSTSTPTPSTIYIVKAHTHEVHHGEESNHDSVVGLYASAEAANAAALKYFLTQGNPFEWVDCKEKKGLLRIDKQYRLEGVADLKVWVEEQKVETEVAMGEVEYKKKLGELMRQTEETRDMKEEDEDEEDEDEEEEEGPF